MQRTNSDVARANTGYLFLARYRTRDKRPSFIQAEYTTFFSFYFFLIFFFIFLLSSHILLRCVKNNYARAFNETRSKDVMCFIQGLDLIACLYTHIGCSAPVFYISAALNISLCTFEFIRWENGQWVGPRIGLFITRSHVIHLSLQIRGYNDDVVMIQHRAMQMY